MLSRDYDVVELCKLMGVSRAGFYKWKKHKTSPSHISRKRILKLVELIHSKHSTHGYRWTAAYIRINCKTAVSDSYVYKCFRFLGLKAETKHKVKYRPRKQRDKYPNLMYSTWETVDRPRQVIVSDMTVVKFKWFYFEITFYFDVFTKEIVTWKLAGDRGDRDQYIDGLKDVVELLKGREEPTILHTDQGSVYASMAYNELIKDTNIVRSMSRAGKPTDNPVNESLNGWIKEELYMDFHIDDCRSANEVIDSVDKYVKYYNNRRPCFALEYDTPNNFFKNYQLGKIERKDTFKNRVLDETPKFVRKRAEDLNNNKIIKQKKEHVNI